MEMETSWKDTNIRITMLSDSFLLKKKEKSEVFDLSPWVPPSIMQYVLTRELCSLQSVLQMRGYILEFDGKHVDVVHVSGKTPKILQHVGNDLCNVLSAFITRFNTRPVLPKLNGEQIDFEEMYLQKVLVTWDPSYCCYWLSGEDEVVKDAYEALQQKCPFLWTFDEGVTFKVENDWKDIRLVTMFSDIGPQCSLVIDPAPYVHRSKLHFLHAEQSIDEVLKSAEPSSDRPSSFNKGAIEVEPFVAGVMNVLVQKTSVLESKAIKINSNSADAQKECPKTYGNVSFYREKDPSVVWITGLKGDVMSSYENIQLFLENGTMLPVLFPKSTKKEIKTNGTVQEEKIDDEDTPEGSMSEMITKEGLVIKIYYGDICNVPVEGIVNAANESLNHAGGVARAISDAAGYEFNKESKDYVKKYGRLNVGSCCVTSAGKLPYKYVIHTVGPMWHDYKAHEKKMCLCDVQEAVEVTFRRAEKLRLQSIAIPAISSGIFGVPKESCTEQYYNAIIAFSKQYTDTSLKEIHFVDVDLTMIRLITTTFEKLSGSKLTRKTMESPFPRQSSSKKEKESRSRSPCRSRSPSTHSSDDDSTVFDITDKTSISLKVGNVAATDGSAIVCPQDKRCSSLGGIAKAIADRLGNMEQDMPSVKIQEDIAPGKVIPMKQKKITVPWEYIFHAVCPTKEKKDSMDHFENDLKETIRNVFKEAESLGLKSLVCPLIGAGGFMNTKQVEKTCVQCLVDVVKELKNGKCPLENISIVVGSVSILNAIKTALTGAGFCCRTKSKPECWKYSKDMRPKYSTSGDLGKPSSSFKGTRSYDKKGTYNCGDKEKCKKSPRLGKCGVRSCPPCNGRQLLDHQTKPPSEDTFEKQKNSQPFGIMKMTKNPKKLPGYDDSDGTIVITYVFEEGYQTSFHPSPGGKYSGITQTAYVPDTEKGRLVTRLLNVAFSRGLLFTVKTSPGCKSCDGRITWNGILHKTSIKGGPEMYGYPDHEYLDLVLEQLAAKDVTKENSSPSEHKEFSRCLQN